ncbi:RNA polymerase sigma factor [Ilumatobacter sp.]|uniref:RNA polymerase sigma factor n=1 Tax=Ilumatobacter sp. TaxID=1967498 RepID=UPI003AF5F9FC
METVDFVELYERTLDEVYRYASRLTGGDRIRTDELVQETYLTVLRQRNRADASVDGATGTPDVTVGYLIVTCRSRFLDGLRASRRRRHREELVAVTDPTVQPIDPPTIDHADAIAALGTLADDQRAALVLRYIDDLAVADVAAHLDRSVRATESLLVRARAALRTAFHERTES